MLKFISGYLFLLILDDYAHGVRLHIESCDQNVTINVEIQ